MKTNVFTSVVNAQDVLGKICNTAVIKACDRLLGKLQELIESEFYGVFEPEQYERSYQFYKSATTEMLTEALGQVFMNPDAMNYPWNGSGWAWTGQEQLEAANVGSHGGWTTAESVQHRYWDEFMKYCEKNAIPILKEELKNAGLQIK